MSTSVCRWGFLSAASIARKNYQAIFHSGNGRVAAVASRDQAKAQHFIDECQLESPFDLVPVAVEGYEALLADPDIDAVYVCFIQQLTPLDFNQDKVCQTVIRYLVNITCMNEYMLVGADLSLSIVQSQLTRTRHNHPVFIPVFMNLEGDAFAWMDDKFFQCVLVTRVQNLPRSPGAGLAVTRSVIDGHWRV